MTLMSLPIGSITENHLRSLIEDRVMQLRFIEYKRELPGKRDKDKREYLADVCSFANTAGGDLYWGQGSSVWNNPPEGDTATLRNSAGTIKDTGSC